MGVGEDHCWVLSLDSLTNKGNWLFESDSEIKNPETRGDKDYNKPE